MYTFNKFTYFMNDFWNWVNKKIEVLDELLEA